MTDTDKLLERALAFMDCYWKGSLIQEDIRKYLERKREDEQREKLSTDCCNLVE